jgi:peptidoglycan hydrolase-like protein with peptidoglycan-binding domain
MRAPSISLTAALLVLSFGTYASAQATIPDIFTANLSLGSRGTQVVILQQILNRDQGTRIASMGPGSPGYETNYFGPLTRAAVVRFQEKYAGEILAPAGLARGNGYVGLYTRAKLSALFTSTTSPGGANPPSAPPVATSTSIVVPPSTPAPLASTTAPQNPNLKNLDKFMAAIDTVGAKQGISAVTIATVKQQILADIATTTDLRASFLKIVQGTSHQAIQNDSSIDGLLATIGQAFEKIFSPEHARAAVGAPFGGALLFPFYCNCSGTWLLTISPLPPTFVALLTYVTGSQAYLSYNIPATEWLLGEYAPGAGVCTVIVGYGCAAIPSEGIITPIVGSSP